MLTINHLLEIGDVDPSDVLLLRHRVEGFDILDVWRADRPLVEAYQRRQLAGAFDPARYVACLLPRPEGNEVFGGLYAVRGSTPADPGSVDALTGDPGKPGEAIVIYDLDVVPDFEYLEDRLVVEWFPKGKHPGWKQRADRNEKRVVEIAAQQERPFPGWMEFTAPVDDLHLLPRGWQEVLRSTSGVYLLTDRRGRHYVGSAKGGGGLLSRWNSYRGGRSGGNVGLVDAVGPYTVTVLQTFDPGLDDQTIEAIESRWKTKLGARQIGYNRN